MTAEYLIAGVVLAISGGLQIWLGRTPAATRGTGSAPARIWRSVAGYIAVIFGVVLVGFGLAGP